jgi:hypothetical protein
MECDLVYGDFEPFQSIHLEDVHMDQFSTVVSTAVI